MYWVAASPLRPPGSAGPSSIEVFCLIAASDFGFAAGHIPGHFLPCAVRDVHHVTGGGSVVPNLGVLGTLFARPDALKELSHVYGHCVGLVCDVAALPLGVGLGLRAVLALVPELLLERLRPAINGILITFAMLFRAQAQTAASEDKRAIGTQELHPLLRCAGVVERGGHVDVEPVVFKQGVQRVGHFAPILLT